MNYVYRYQNDKIIHLSYTEKGLLLILQFIYLYELPSLKVVITDTIQGQTSAIREFSQMLEQSVSLNNLFIIQKEQEVPA